MEKMFNLRLPLNEGEMLERCGVVSDADRSKVVRHCIHEHFAEYVEVHRTFSATFNDKATSARKPWTFRLSVRDREQLRACAAGAGWKQTKMIRYWLGQYFEEHGQN